MATNGRRICECGFKYRSHLSNCPKCGAPEWSADFEPFDPRHWIYDLETYPKIFTADFKHPNTGARLLFEISDRKNEISALLEFLEVCQDSDITFIGFNNEGFDYPIIHYIMDREALTVDAIYQVAQQIIETPWQNRFDNIVPVWKRYIRQIDLYKLHHFDNEARSTSLKVLQFNMRSDSIVDLPYAPGSYLDDQQKDVLIEYNHHDDDETETFYFYSLDKIAFRDELSAQYGKDYANFNDTKIGKSYFASELEKVTPGICYDENRKPRQTIRQVINLGDAVFDYIQFSQPEFNRILNYFKTQQITETKGVFEDLVATVEGFKYHFGAGGIHGSIDSAIVESDTDYVIYDWDVASYYPNLAIANRLYPEHLSETFCDIYQQVYERRKQHPKGSVMNAALKLALNGVYGDSNSEYSPFYDPLYTMSITINGQLLLCVLAENLIRIPGLSMVQINTDGLTVKCPRQYVDSMKQICAWWENFTCLQLESAVYSRMFIRDVNNYIAESESGKLKRKGAYCYETPLDNLNTLEREWHKNHSALVVPKAAESALVHGTDPREFIYSHGNVFDFMLRAKVGRKDQLLWGNVELQRTSRYYVSIKGDDLRKISPPVQGHLEGTWKRATGITKDMYYKIREEIKNNNGELDIERIPWDERINTKNKSKYKTRTEIYHRGYVVTECNNMSTFDLSNLNYEFYIAEAMKLIEPLRRG